MKHKKKGEREVYHALTLKRDELKELIEQETRKIFNRIKEERYLGGNKTGKYLARILKNKNYIEKIQNSTEEMVFTTKDIAGVFQKYYRELYSIKQRLVLEKARLEKMKTFLREVSLNKIPEDRLSAL